MKYIRRTVDNEIDILSKAFGCINILGPKGCGKTRTASERCKTIVAFEDEDNRESYLSLAASKPSAFLKMARPILFDEWQDAPKIWGAIRNEIDCNDECFGDFYLTGSSSKEVDVAHSGTGRIATIEMLPMSLYESGESNGTVSLSALFDDPSAYEGAISSLSLDHLLFAAARGGWPRTLAMDNDESKLRFARNYLFQVCNRDCSTIDGRPRDPELVSLIIKSYARNCGTLAKTKVIYDDVIANKSVSDSTFYDYVSILKKLYVIEDIKAWAPQIRSEKSLRSPVKRMFIDPSLAIASLGLSPKYFIKDFDTFGHIFESLVFRDLKSYLLPLGGSLSHYRDAYGLEVDCIAYLNDGRYGLIEIKLGDGRVGNAIKGLCKFADLIRNKNAKHDGLPLLEPTFMMVITGGQVGYRSEEGVLVVPIGCLAP